MPQLSRIVAPALRDACRAFEPRLPGVAEPAEVTGSGDAIFVVGVDMERRPGAVGDAHHAAALVGHQEPARAAADRAALVPDDRIVDAGAVDIAPLHRIAGVVLGDQVDAVILRSEEHTSELQSLMRISYAVFCWKK